MYIHLLPLIIAALLLGPQLVGLLLFKLMRKRVCVYRRTLVGYIHVWIVQVLGAAMIVLSIAVLAQWIRYGDLYARQLSEAISSVTMVILLAPVYVANICFAIVRVLRVHERAAPFAVLRSLAPGAESSALNDVDGDGLDESVA